MLSRIAVSIGAPLRLFLAFLSVMGFFLLIACRAVGLDYDDDVQITFVWTPSQGNFDHYNIYVSVDGAEYRLGGTSSSER